MIIFGLGIKQHALKEVKVILFLAVEFAIMGNKVQNLLSSILLISQVSAFNTNTTLYVDSNGSTLYHYSKNVIIESFTQLQFIGQNHSLNTTFGIKNLRSISLIGLNHTATILCTGENAGFIFQEVAGLEIKNLTLIGCGTFFNHYRASLVIQNGSNLTLVNITILEAKDAGIYSCNVNGTTFISNLKISNVNATSKQSGGNQISYNSSTINGTIDGYELMLQDSEITNNTVNKGKINAGLTIAVSKCFGSINITRSKFINNIGIKRKGGNLAIVMDNITDIFAQLVNIRDSIIDGGRAASGAGLYLFITKYVNTSYPITNQHNNFSYGATTIENVTFRNNVADFLGAAFYVQLKASTQSVTSIRPHRHYTITLVNCNFTNNSLTHNKKGGIAIHSNYFDIDNYLLQIKPQYNMTLKNITFQNHIVQNKETSGNSVIFINTNDLFVIKNVTVTNNGANAITAVASNILLEGNTVLSHNKGSSGGGLLLCQNSILYLTPKTTLEIYNNSVSHAGGGIYVEPRCLQEKPPCFFQVDNEIKTNNSLITTVSVHVYNNTASYGGHNLFGGDIDFCYMIDSPNQNKSPFTNQQAYQDIFTISNKSSSVTSLPRHICFCQNHEINCQNGSPGLMSLYPGEAFTIEAVLVGQMNGTVPGVVQTWVQDMSQTMISLNGKVQNISHECTLLNYTIGTASSKERNLHIKLAIGVQHTGDQSGYERLPSFHNKNANVKHVDVDISECPIGFALSPSNSSNIYTCSECVVGTKDFKCHIEMPGRVLIKRQPNANAWMGFEYSDNNSLPTAIRYNKNCPFDYCGTSAIELNMRKGSYNITHICANSRSGTMCGACKEHYSAMLGSSKCSKCTNRFLLLLLAFTFAGILLVAVLTLLNLTVAEGTLSGLIFYANVIECNSSFIIPHKDYHIFPTPIFRVFLAWIKLRCRNTYLLL